VNGKSRHLKGSSTRPYDYFHTVSCVEQDQSYFQVCKFAVEGGAALPARTESKMGACMSSNNEALEQKKISQMIDKKLEEDSRRLRRECKILLLGRP
jgi:hypothetical protein